MKNLYSLKEVKQSKVVKNINKNIIPTTFEQQLERFIDYLKSGKGRVPTASTIKGKTDAIKAVYNRMGGIEFSPEWISQMKNRLDEEGRSKATQIAYIYAVLDFFIANGHEGSLPTIKTRHGEIRGISRPELVEEEANWHTRDEIKKLIAAAGNPRDTAIMTLLYYGALRNKELRYLWIEDVDTKNKTIRVRDRGAGVKNYEGRTIPIPEKAIPAVKAWLDVRASMDEVMRAEGIHTNLMFISQRGQQIQKDGLTQIVLRVGKRAGIDTHPHALRHSRCSHLVNDAKLPVTQAQKLLGHKTLLTTQKYSHATIADIAANVNAYDQ